jgi:hypothetical protein
MSKLNKKQAKVLVESLASEFLALDVERQRIEREARQLKKRLDELKQGLQGMVGVAEELDVPYVARIGRYYITQIKKHRDVDSYSYDFIDFKVAGVQ